MADALHQRLLDIAAERSASDLKLGACLLEAQRVGLHVALGYGSFAEYVERLFGFSRRQTEERLRVARALDALPRMTGALGAGHLSWSAVRELTRIATADTEAEWIEEARSRTVRELERMVVCREPGDRPSDRPKAEPRKRVVLDLTAPTWALLQEARAQLVRQGGGHVDDDDLVTALTGAILQSSRSGQEEEEPDSGDERKKRDDGRSSYQVALTVCERCQTASQRAGADEVVVNATRVAMAECDSERLGRVDGPEVPRASQTIPPKIRRAVLRRHGRQCAVPGCRHGTFVDVHHVERRVDGGGHDPDGLIVLCSAHHAAVHEGAVVIRGTYTAGFSFEHADGSSYGNRSASPDRARVMATTLSALVGMGFRQKEAQAMVDGVSAHVGADLSAEQALRAALAQSAIASRGGGAMAVREPAARYGPAVGFDDSVSPGCHGWSVPLVA